MLPIFKYVRNSRGFKVGKPAPWLVTDDVVSKFLGTYTSNVPSWFSTKLRVNSRGTCFETVQMKSLFNVLNQFSEGSWTTTLIFKKLISDESLIFTELERWKYGAGEHFPYRVEHIGKERIAESLLKFKNQKKSKIAKILKKISINPSKNLSTNSTNP